MIFATVGTQLPFPRLIDALDRIAPTLDEEIVAQTGATGGKTGTAMPWPHLTAHATLAHDDFATSLAAARVVVAHAGIGTVLSARQQNKPLIVVPRQSALGEHRNDHQTATARQIESMPGIHVCWDIADLEALLRRPDLEPASEVAGPTRAALVERLRAFIGTP